MAILNISRFHLFNELYGHEAGDNILVYLANILKDIARDNDGIVARLQDDYFAFYINHHDDYDHLLDHIYAILKDKYEVSNVNLRLGIYESKDDSISIENRIERAKLVCDEIRKCICVQY